MLLHREASIADYEAALGCLPGDVVVASSFMSYAGPFPSEYRDELVKHTWLPQVRVRCWCMKTACTFGWTGWQGGACQGGWLT